MQLLITPSLLRTDANKAMAPETYQVKLPLACSDSQPLADGEAEEEMEDVSPTSLNDFSSVASEGAYDGGCADSADIITSAAATWCVHAAFQSPKRDPLVSFFAQLLSSHTIAASADEIKCEQQDASLVSDVSVPEKSPCSNDSNARGGSVWVRTTSTSSSTSDAVQESVADEGGSPSAIEEGCVTDSTNHQLRLYLEGSLKRELHIQRLRKHLLKLIHLEQTEHTDVVLPSSRKSSGCFEQLDLKLNAFASGNDNPSVCGAFDYREQHNISKTVARRIERREEAPKESFDSPLAATSNALSKDEHVSLSLTADDLLPPPVPVDLDFCNFHPRIAVNWLVHAQVTASLMNEKGAPPPSSEFNTFQSAETKRLDVDSEAQLACLVAPDALGKGAPPVGSKGRGSSKINPVRDALKVTTARLLRSLDAEGAEALAALLHSWYYSGFFTGQLRGHSRGLID
ncbi:hypothetical protein Esti_003557 [Eimeria stiedai]